MNKKFARLILTVVLLMGLLVVGFYAVQPASADGQNGTTLSATKTATAHLTRTFHWTIDKSVTPDTLDMFTGDSGTVQYTIQVTKDTGTLAAWVDGQICVTNGGAVATEGLQIVDNVTMPPDQTVIASVNVDVSANPVLDPGETYCYNYHVDIPSGSVVPGATYKDTADITITNHSGHLDTPFGPGPSATSLMPASPTLINDTINVDDTNGGSWSFSNSGSESYSKDFTCDADEGTHNNTATIRETGQSDSASVTVNCYQLQVTKDASTSVTRTWTWTINKSADQTALTLSTGQSFVVNYEVKVDASSTDSNWAVSGNISVSNPAPIAATLNGVSDVVSSNIAASVDCGVTFPYTLASDGTLSCTYSASLPDASDRTNTATATLQNTPSGTTDFSGTANVSFGNATVNQVDECINISDSYAGDLGTVCANSAPKTFTYSRTIGPYSTCGDYTVDNTADFTTNDNGSTGSASWTVNVYVPCAGGCTLTQGYWKTHSLHGPAPYDDAWLNLGPAGADTTFFLSGKTWYQVFWTPPAGNIYYNLADQYMAAKLNSLNGASTPLEVQTALNNATTLFNTYTPAQVAALKSSNSVRKQFIDLASTLDNYNNGLIGPGHCSE